MMAARRTTAATAVRRGNGESGRVTEFVLEGRDLRFGILVRGYLKSVNPETWGLVAPLLRSALASPRGWPLPAAGSRQRSITWRRLRTILASAGYRSSPRSRSRRLHPCLPCGRAWQGLHAREG